MRATDFQPDRPDRGCHASVGNGCHAPRLRGHAGRSASRRRGHARRGFTLVELLIVITIIGILAGLSYGALNAARQAARVSKTKATIAKLDAIIMSRYEEYTTRRVPINTAGLHPDLAAMLRLKALRQLMRLEMPDRISDIVDPGNLSPIQIEASITTPSGATRKATRPLAIPSLNRRYAAFKSEDLGESECLYLIISCGSAEDREQFSENEIADVDGDGLLEFVDGWGKPIGFLLWAPGFSRDESAAEFGGVSEIQTGNPITDHDPFDVQGVEEGAFHLIPLIYSGGPDKTKDIDMQKYDVSGSQLAENPYAYDTVGMPLDDPGNPDGELNHHDNIHNHLIQ